MVTLAVCLTCFNRRETTLSSLRDLARCAVPQQLNIKIYLVDDGSSDGTSEAVACEFPDVELMHGDGSLFWGGGMRLAFGAAIEHRHEFYLWLNDDVNLQPDALVRLIETHRFVSRGGRDTVIVVGAASDPETGRLSYSGHRQSRINPLKFEYIYPDTEKPLLCDTMNGNIVLIPAEAARRVGNIDPLFPHTIGDTDYGLRARRLGIKTWMCPGYLATCQKNLRKWHWQQPEYSLWERIRFVNHPLGQPFRPYMRFAFRHGGLWGAILALWAYRRLFFPGLFGPQAEAQHYSRNA
jgi:GT2 family glycosyltransferase